MTSTSEFATYCTELLGALGRTRMKRMFGGYGFYVDEVFIAVSMNDRLYLKSDVQTQLQFQSAGCDPFVYHQDGKPTSLNYWSVPDEAMESSALLLPWARLAMEAGLRKVNAKLAPRKKATAPERLRPARAAPAQTPLAPTKKRASAETAR